LGGLLLDDEAFFREKGGNPWDRAEILFLLCKKGLVAHKRRGEV
jgi:hypothetical protein